MTLSKEEIQARVARMTVQEARKLMSMALELKNNQQTHQPKYAQLMLLLREYQRQQQQRKQAQQPVANSSNATNASRAPTDAATQLQQNPMASLLFSATQLQDLHKQIRAYKALCQSMDQRLTSNDTPEPTAWTRESKNLAYLGPSSSDGSNLHFTKGAGKSFGQWYINSPHLALNDATVKLRYMQTLQQFLTSSLSALESRESELSTDELETLRDLRCALLQQRLRSQLSKVQTRRLTMLGEPLSVDRRHFRRHRPQTRTELQEQERQATQSVITKQKQQRAERQMYLKAVMNHARDFFIFQKNAKALVSRSARSAKTHVEQKLQRIEREEDKQEKLRLKALKMNDMEAYSQLVAEAKNERLTFLLSQTNEYLDRIRALVSEHKRKHHVVDADTFSNAQEVEDDLNLLSVAAEGELPRQPRMLVGGDLKEYQLRGLQWMVSLYDNHLNGILADEMGLGKTIQTIALLTYVAEVKHNHGPFLVVVPLSTLSNWSNEFAKWAPDLVLVTYKGPPHVRKELQKSEMASTQFNVLLTTYEYIMKDKHVLRKFDWQYIVVDEGHRMKNAQSKFATTLGSVYRSRNRLLLTGTPLQNSLPELWSLLNFLLPTIFESVDSFEQWFSQPFAQFGGSGESDALSDEERMLIINRLHQVLRPFLLRRLKTSVLNQLPDKVEKVLKCELSGWQKILYRRIQKDGALLLDSTDESGKTKTKYTSRGLSNVLMQLRKVCNHPYLFMEQGYLLNFDMVRSSGKFELLDRMLPKLQRAGHRVLLFSQMTQLMHVLEDYFRYRGFRHLRLDGSTSADEREQRMFQFNAPDSPYFIFLLSTRAGGLGLNLATADTVIIFDSDWNPAMDAQAQDRAHRIGQKNEVRVFRLVSNSPVEEKILARATDKMTMNNLVVEAGKFNNKSKEEERRAMLESLLKNDEEEKEEDTDKVQVDEEINHMMALTDEELALYQRMDDERGEEPRLMTELDAPEWLREANARMQERTDSSVLDITQEAKGRVKKPVSYKEQSEADFLRMCEGEEVGKKRKSEDKREKMLNYFYRKIYDGIVKLQDEDGRARCELYMEKPSAQLYPDYYRIIQDPMDLLTIKSRVDRHKYSSHEAFEQDIALMVENAQTYNHPDSLVYVDSQVIWTFVQEKMMQVKSKSEEELMNEYEVARQEHKKRAKARRERKRARR